MQFGVTDFVSGVRSLSAVFEGRTGQQVTCTGFSTDGALPQAANWLCNLNVPPASGRWHLVSVTTTDGAGNTLTRTPADLEPLRGVFQYTFLEYDFDSDYHN